MPNPAPVLRLHGTVHSTPLTRQVEAREARPEQRDPATGEITQRAQEAREGYQVTDVLVLTDDGGFVTVLFRDEAVQAAGGFLPERGDSLDGLPVLSYVARQNNNGRWFSQVGLSFAGAVYAADQAAHGTGSRIAAAS
jgi:hypothetical protein